MKTLEEAISVIRDLVEGRAVTYEGTELQPTWTGKWRPPVWVAGLRAHGPGHDRSGGGRAHPPARRSGPHPLVRRAAARSGGRCLQDSWRDQRRPPRRHGTWARRDLGRDRTRWFPALVSNHVLDLVNKYPREQLPEALTGYHRPRGLRLPPPCRGGVHQRRLRRRRVTDRFCILGELTEHVSKPRSWPPPCRPVQPVPHERRRGGAAGPIRPRGCARSPRCAAASRRGAAT